MRVEWKNEQQQQLNQFTLSMSLSEHKNRNDNEKNIIMRVTVMHCAMERRIKKTKIKKIQICRQMATKLNCVHKLSTEMHQMFKNVFHHIESITPIVVVASIHSFIHLILVLYV